MKSIITKPCELTDDLEAVIDLIIETDAYIYPPMFRCCTKEKYTFMRKCLNDKESIFYYKNILLAKQNEKIVGILIAFTERVHLASEDVIESCKCAADIAYANERYFKPLFDEYADKSFLVYISNICTHPDFRNLGVGKKLLTDFLNKHYSDVELDVLCDNPVAILLYRKFGFDIMYSENAFAFEEIPNFKSYRMKRKAVTEKATDGEKSDGFRFEDFSSGTHTAFGNEAKKTEIYP